MGIDGRLAQEFENNRTHLRAVAFRILGSASESEDAVQEGWLRASRADTAGVENLAGWLTTIVARVCLDMLRSRKSRREEPLDDAEPDAGQTLGPEDEALLADSVGFALNVVLDTLAPAERLVFVLHDLFAVPFDEIALIVGRSSAAAKQLASRARRRVQDAAMAADPDLSRQRVVVDAFLAASRQGDFDALFSVLAPDVVLRADLVAVPPGQPSVVRGAEAVARQAHGYSRRARFGRPALIDGAIGLVLAPAERVVLAMGLTVVDGLIAKMDVIADPERMAQLEIVILD